MNWGNVLRMEVVNNTPSLTSLALSVYTVTPEIATAIARNTVITDLTICDCEVPAPMAAILFAKPKLRSLHIQSHHHCKSPEYLRHLHVATDLRALTIDAAHDKREEIAKDLIRCLIRCTQLQSLSIPGFHVGAEGVQQLTLHMPIMELKLSDESLGATGLLHVRNNSTLRTLSLSGGSVGGLDGMRCADCASQHLGDNNSIYSLTLHLQSDINNENLLLYLKRNTTLTQLSFSTSAFALSEPVCRAFSLHPSLRSLTVRANDGGNLLEAFAHRAPPHLTGLSITDSILPASFSWPLLSNLRVASLSITSQPLPAGCVLPLLSNSSLTKLDLHGLPYTVADWNFTHNTGLKILYSGEHTVASKEELHKKLRQKFFAHVVMLVLARAKGTSATSFLMQTPFEVFTHILSSVSISEIGLPRWKLAAIVRFYMANREKLEWRLKNGFSLKLTLQERVSEIDFVFVSWAVPEYDLEKDKRLRKEEAVRRAEEERHRKEAEARQKNSPGPIPWFRGGDGGLGGARRSWGF